MQTSKWVAVAGAVLLTIELVGGPGRVLAQADDGDVIHACVDKNGHVRVVGPDESCKGSETGLAWNIVGPEGPQGPPGPPGDSHWLRNGADTFYEDGNVGVGVQPEATLDVNGVIRTTTLEIIGGTPAQRTLVAWGKDTSGQISRMPTTTTDTFTVAAAGGSHSLAIRSDGTLASWGQDNVGQVSQTPAGTFIAIAAGSSHSVAIRDDGSLVSWGDDNFGVVSQTPTTGVYAAVATGSSHSVALRDDGTLVSWGYDFSGQVSQTPTSGSFIAVAAGSSHSLAIRSDGTLFSWGWDGFDGLGLVSQTPTSGSFVAIAGGLAHSLAIRNDGTLVSWGRDDDGQVGQTPTTGLYIAVAAGWRHSLALRRDPTPFSPGLELATDSAVKPGTNTWTILSDRRLKKNIRPLSGALDRLLRLRGVTFEWLDPVRAGGHHGRDIGLVADEVQDVFPRWVRRDRKGYLTLTVGGFEALTAESLRELRAEKDAEIAELTARLRKLEALVATLAEQQK